MRKIYAQLDGAGVCVAITETSGIIDAPNVREVADGNAVIGKRWDGAQWLAVVDRKRDIDAALAAIDRQSGMGRLLRETLIAIGGNAVPAILKTHENSAAALRAERAGL
jgi:hypothetical protein